MQTKLLTRDELCKLIARLVWHGYNVQAIAAKTGIPVDRVASYRSDPACHSELDRLSDAAKRKQGI